MMRGSNTHMTKPTGASAGCATAGVTVSPLARATHKSPVEQIPQAAGHHLVITAHLADFEQADVASGTGTCEVQRDPPGGIHQRADADEFEGASITLSRGQH